MNPKNSAQQSADELHALIEAQRLQSKPVPSDEAALAAALLERAQAAQPSPAFLLALENELAAAYAPKPRRGFARWFGRRNDAALHGKWVQEEEPMPRTPSIPMPNQRPRNSSKLLGGLVGAIAFLALGVFVWAWLNRPTPHSAASPALTPMSQPQTPPPSFQSPFIPAAEFDNVLALDGAPGVVVTSNTTNDSVLLPGETYSFTLQWQALQPINIGYGIFVQMRMVNGEVVVQSDVPLAGDPFSPKPKGQEFQTLNVLTVPSDFQTNLGAAEFYVGVYELKTGKRLSLTKVAGVLQGGGAFLLLRWPMQPAVASATAQPVASEKAVLSPALKNARYVFENAPDYSVQLVDGKFEQVNLMGNGPEIAFTFTMNLLEQMGYGDLNGDGRPDAAVILKDNNRVSLAAVLFETDTVRPLPAKQFGNSPIEMQSVTIEGNRIVLSYDVTGFSWRASDTPQIHITHTFQLSGELLSEMSYTETLKFTSIITDFPDTTVEAAAQPGSGHCEETYEQELGRTDIYYCAGGPFGRMTGLPYCFLYADKTALLCVRTPVGVGEVVRLEKFGQLPQPFAKFEGTTQRPWFVMLSDGTSCGRFAPMAERSQPALQTRETYRCDDGNSLLIGELDTSNLVWKAKKIRRTLGGYLNVKDAREVEIATAWQ